jgi:hypothetical protein
MRTITIKATPATEQITAAWLAHLVLDIPTVAYWHANTP